MDDIKKMYYKAGVETIKNEIYMNSQVTKILLAPFKMSSCHEERSLNSMQATISIPKHGI